VNLTAWQNFRKCAITKTIDAIVYASEIYNRLRLPLQVQGNADKLACNIRDDGRVMCGCQHALTDHLAHAVSCV